jgi:diguanylate cyclase (GGDEF)-like protein
MREEASELLAKSLHSRTKSRENRGLLLLTLKLLLYVLLFAVIFELFNLGSVGQFIKHHPTLANLRMVFLGLALAIVYVDLLTVRNWQSIRRACNDLVTELSHRDAAERLSLVDPITGTFSRRYLEDVIPRETARADRNESTLSFVKISIERFDTIDPAKGFQTSERLLVETGQLLKRTFGPTAIIIRLAVADFLVVLPETAKRGALAAVRRLLTKAEDLNRHKAFQEFALQFGIGLADYTKGRDVRDSLAAVETRVQIYRDKQSAGA